MESPARGQLRWARSAALAVATLGLAATVHTLAGGAVPSVPALAVLTLVTALACVVLTAHQRGFPSVVVAMTLLQVALHEGFMALVPMGCHAADDRLSAHAGMHGALSTAGAACVSGHAAGDGLSIGMLAGHGIVTLLLASALASGERALWRLRQLVLPTLPRQIRPVLLHPVQVAEPPVMVVRTVWTSVSSLVRRGPPAGVAVVPG